MRKTKLLFILPILAILSQGCDDSKKGKNFNDKIRNDEEDAMFIKLANETGLTGIKASMLAEHISKKPRVIQFAKMVINDHKQAGDELLAVAKNKSIVITNTISSQHQKRIDSLNKLTTGFDKAYMKLLLIDHVTTIKLFEHANASKNNAVQQYAKKTLPILKMHLDSAKAIVSTLQ